MKPKILTVDDSKTIRLIVTKAFKTFDCDVFEAANGVGTLSGVAVETDDRTGLAKRIAPVRLGPGLSRAVPEFWEADASGD